MMIPMRGSSSAARLWASGVVVIVFLAGLSVRCLAQDYKVGPPPLPVDPTPIKDLLSNSERASLAEVHSYKKLVEVYLNISDTHLDAADKAIGGEDIKTAERELDVFTKAAAEAANTAFGAGKEEAKPQNRASLGKKIEQRLYAQIRKLQAIERRFPQERVGFAEAALNSANKLRQRVLNETLALGEVLTEPAQNKKEVDVGSAPPPPIPQLNLRPAGAYSTPTKGEILASFQDGADYLSQDEEDAVKEAQDIDKRTKVFMKIAGRRLLAITGASDVPPTEKPLLDKLEKKGPLAPPPDDSRDAREGDVLEKLSRAELLHHYSRAIEELMDKMEDAHDRNPKSSALKRALNILADDTEKQLVTLRSLEPAMKDEAESHALRGAISKAEEASKGAREALKAF
jgi:hypothetical protein